MLAEILRSFSLIPLELHEDSVASPTGVCQPNAGMAEAVPLRFFEDWYEIPRSQLFNRVEAILKLRLRQHTSSVQRSYEIGAVGTLFVGVTFVTGNDYVSV